MKKVKLQYVMMLLAMGIIAGCSNENVSEDVANSTEEVRMGKPGELGMDLETLEEEVQQGSDSEIEANREELVDEAVYAIEKIQEAILSLVAEEPKEALDALEAATGKLEILIARDPDLALVPIDASVKTVDLVADLETIKTIKKAARRAIKEDRFQALRDELVSLASEVQISTVQMPLATFPTAMKAAAALIESGDLEDAQNTLSTALNSLVIKERRIPLPILRAQAMIDQAKSDDALDEDKKKEVLQLLENAEYQLILAEELGYGERDEKYGELSEAISELKQSVEDDGQSQGLFKSLKEKLSKFKDRMGS